MAEIVKATEIEFAEMGRFYREAFPERGGFLAEHWRWLYRVGRFPGIEPLVLVKGRRVVGQAGVIPVMLARLGKTAPAMWFVDFSILPEFQGKGHGKALTEAWMAQCPDRITFCNERSIEVFLKFGWKERFDACALTRPVELSAPLARRWGAAGSLLGSALNAPARAWLSARSLGAPALNVMPLPLDAGGLAERLDAPSGEPRVVRDADWVRWRLLENPRRAELFIADAEGISAVFRLFESLGRRRAHLLHVGPGAAPARAAMLKAFARWGLDHKADDLWLATSDQALLAAGAPLFARRTALRFAWHSADGAVADALARPLTTQGIDSDHDLMFP